MPSPFPGMNPYLENPDFWAGLHHRLMTAIANTIEANLNPDYRVEIEKRVYTITPEDAVLIGIPDVSVLSQTQASATSTLTATDTSITVLLPTPEEVREAYLEIRDMKVGKVITVIEVLSPTNKRAGIGRNIYEEKRNAVLESATHLVEIDLLRRGKPMTMTGRVPTSDYRILVSRAPQRPRAQLYAFNLQQPIPSFNLPLQPSDPELPIDLQQILQTLYQQARYDMAIDYQQDPVPPVDAEQQAWMDALLVERSVRSQPSQ
jgi:hypothetical protein